jgi:hypothetical protein
MRLTPEESTLWLKKASGLYEAGPKNILFDRRSFYWSLLRGAIHGCIIFFMAAAAMMGGGQVRRPVFIDPAACDEGCLCRWIAMASKAATTSPCLLPHLSR